MRYYKVLLCVLISVSAQANKTVVEQIDSVITSTDDYNRTIGILRNFPDKELVSFLKKSESKKSRCKILNALCWRNFVSDPRNSMHYAQLQLKESQHVNEPIYTVAAYDNLSYLHLNNSENSIAIDYMLKSLKLKEEMGDQAGISVSLSGLAGTYYQMKNFELALSYFEQSLALEKKNNDTSIEGARRLGSVIGNIGQCKIELGMIDEGLKDLEKSVALYKSTGQESDAGTNFGNIGLAYLKYKENYTKALEYFFMAEKLHVEKRDFSSLASIQSNIGETYSIMGDFTNALRYGKKALKNAKQSGDRGEIMDANMSLAKAFYQSGNYKLAYEYYQQAFNLKDTIFSAQSAEQIAEMQTKYNTEKKEAENKLLKTEKELDRAELKRKSAQQRMLLIGLLVVVLITGYVAYSLIQKKKTNKLLNQQNEEISSQKEIIEEKNKDITDSINYAQRIQNAILPDDDLLKKHFESFIYYKPKDIVSGDFYWVKEVGDRIYFSVVDCTGHGVPGAFMSIIGYNSLNRIVEENGGLTSGEILDKLNDVVIESIARESKEGMSIRDGMDLSFCCYNKVNGELEYAGAHNALYVIRTTDETTQFGVEAKMAKGDQKLFELKADKMPIGGEKNNAKYRTVKLNIQPKDSIYLFSDGFADQFGGPKGKKFMYKRFKELLLGIQSERMPEQMNRLNAVMNDWMGELDQLDDICVMGVRF